MMYTPIANVKVRRASLPPGSFFDDPSHLGKFLPTRRTPGISTSDLLARLVSGYRHRAWDKKLEKMGLRQLMAEGSDWDESRVGSRVASTDVSREGSRAHSPDRFDKCSEPTSPAGE